MKTLRTLLLSVFALILAASAAPAQQITCNQNAIFDGSANATMFAPPAGGGNRQMFICGYTINASAAATVQLKYGTGAACVTASTALTPAWVLAIGGQVMDDAGIWHGLTVPAGQSLCLFTGAAVQAIVYFVYL